MDRVQAVEAVEAAVEALRKGMIAADGPKLRLLTSANLSYGHTSGVVENQEEFIEAICSADRRDVFQEIVISEQTIEVDGNVAVVRHRFGAKVLVHGNLMQPDIRVLQVWHRKDGWQLAARQAYKV